MLLWEATVQNVKKLLDNLGLNCFTVREVEIGYISWPVPTPNNNSGPRLILQFVLIDIFIKGFRAKKISPY